MTAFETSVNDALAAEHEPAGESDIGYLLHRYTEGGEPYLLATCWLDDVWDGMPGEVVRTAIAQHVTGYAATLTRAGFGTVVWEFRGQPRVLIIAPDRARVDAIAPAVRALLAEHNGGGAA